MEKTTGFLVMLFFFGISLFVKWCVRKEANKMLRAYPWVLFFLVISGCVCLILM